MDAPYHYVDNLQNGANQWVRVFDRRLGHGPRENNHVAETNDAEMAQRIVDLLNADERLRDQAMLTKYNTEISK